MRAMLSCLLALALPIQGVAAATMFRCVPAQEHIAHAHGGGPGQASVPALHSGAHHQHDMKAGEAPAQAGPTLASADTRCSVCASCCIATALPTALPAFDASAPAESFAPTSLRVDPLFLTGGPERPPRPSNA